MYEYYVSMYLYAIYVYMYISIDMLKNGDVIEVMPKLVAGFFQLTNNKVCRE